MGNISLLVRRWRHALMGPHPLVRRSDRILARLAVVFVLVAALMIPVAATFGSVLHAKRVDIAAWQQATRTSVTARVLESVPPVSRVARYPSMGTPVRRQARALWHTPGAGVRTGTITVAAGTKAGDSVGIWVDRFGRPVDAPLSPQKVAAGATFLAVLAWTAFAGLLAVVYVALRAGFERGSRRAWEREWQLIDGCSSEQ